MIYIKDMDMPVDCLACRISCKNEHYLEDGRPFDCPLEEAKDGDLISRADAIEAVKETKPIVRSTERNWGKMIAEQHSKELVKAIKALPSAEAVQGEWIEKGGELVCSVCGNSVSFSRTPKGWVLGKFCQTCGARMTKGGDDE